LKNFHYTYRAFGRQFPLNADGTDQIGGSPVKNPFGYTGQRKFRDNRSYDFMWYFKNRIYKPDLGRFLQRDPAGYVDGINLYAYVKNNPLRYLDTFGLNLTSTNAINSVNNTADPNVRLEQVDPNPQVKRQKEVFGEFVKNDGLNELLNAFKNNNVQEGLDILQNLAQDLNANVSANLNFAFNGVLGPGATVSAQVDATGNANVSVGIGMGVGAGGSITVGGGMGSSGTVSVGISASGGTGTIGGSGNFSIGFEGPSLSGGVGVGGGIGITITGRGQIISSDGGGLIP